MIWALSELILSIEKCWNARLRRKTVLAAIWSYNKVTEIAGKAPSEQCTSCRSSPSRTGWRPFFLSLGLSTFAEYETSNRSYTAGQGLLHLRRCAHAGTGNLPDRPVVLLVNARKHRHRPTSRRLISISSTVSGRRSNLYHRSIIVTKVNDIEKSWNL